MAQAVGCLPPTEETRIESLARGFGPMATGGIWENEPADGSALSLSQIFFK